MPKSRNQLRLERRRAESEKPGTIQYIQAHRKPRPRRWMLDDTTRTLLQSVLSMLARRRANVAQMRVEARGRYRGGRVREAR